jgi:imidazolonepropionase-like amidohydrolase
MIAPAREGGVTSVISLPAGGLIAGQAAFLDLVDGTAPDMLVRAPAVMVAQVGSDDDADVGSRGQLMAKLRTFIEDTRYYAGHRAEFDRGQTRSLSAGRADLDAMIPVVQGRVPLLVEADKSSDILAAIALGREYGLKVVIAGGAEAWMVAHELAAARVPVLAGAMMNIPYAFTALGSRQDNVALLRKAGVEVALVGNAGGGDEELFNVRNIRFEAGNAVGYGMSRDDALRAVTLGPALIFGVADRVGSLSAGREANVVVWDGDPFEFASHAEVVFVRGRRYQDHSRQDQLTDRYKTLPPAYQKP